MSTRYTSPSLFYPHFQCRYSLIIILISVIAITCSNVEQSDTLQELNDTIATNNLNNRIYPIDIKRGGVSSGGGRSGGRSGGSRSGASRSGSSSSSRTSGRSGGTGRNSGTSSRTVGGKSGGSKSIPSSKTPSSRPLPNTKPTTYKSTQYVKSTSGYKTPIVRPTTSTTYIGPFSRYPRVGYIPTRYILVVWYIYFLSDFDDNDYDYNMDGYSDEDEVCTVYNVSTVSSLKTYNNTDFNMTEINELYKQENYTDSGELLYYINNIGYLNVTEYDAYKKNRFVIMPNGTYVFNFSDSLTIAQESAIFTECESDAYKTSMSLSVFIVTLFIISFLQNV